MQKFEYKVHFAKMD